jgi:hypothetical protein
MDPESCDQGTDFCGQDPLNPDCDMDEFLR